MNKTAPVLIQSGLPVLLIGEPGTGKTAWVRSFAKSLNIHVETLIGSVLDPTDVGGLPAPDGDRARYLLPDWFCRLSKAGGGILFLDELTCSAPSVQAALLRVVHERAIHGSELPPRTWIVAAANPPEQAAGGWDLAAPLANRFAHLQWAVDAEHWMDGMVSGWSQKPEKALPAGWERRIGEQRGIIAGYIRHSPASLQKMPEQDIQRSNPWPSARTWDNAAVALAACEAAEIEPHDALGGIIGDGESIAFLHWRKSLDLPDPETLLANPDKCKLPDRDDNLFISLNALASAYVRTQTANRWDAAWIILGRVAETAPDVGAIAARQVAQHRPKGGKTPKQAAAYLPLLKEMGE